MSTTAVPRPLSGRWKPGFFLAVLAAVLCSSCTAPIGADRVSGRKSYAEGDANALRTGKPSASTVAILRRYDLGELVARRPDEAVRWLHEKALQTSERDLLFALSEISFIAGERIRRSVQPWEPRTAQDYYLGAAIYAWLYLYGEAAGDRPGPYDRRFRAACDFYNHNLGLAFTGRRSTNATVQIEFRPRRLPVGEILVKASSAAARALPSETGEILLADQFQVRGLSVRNRQPGLGAPLICVGAMNLALGIQPATPATMLLRGPGSLRELHAGPVPCALEFYSGLDADLVTIGKEQVPLELDLTTYQAYILRQSRIWNLGRLQFLAPSERIASRLVLNQPFDPQRIPLVLVHGTFSSPITWAELANSLQADPEIRRRYQFWTFIYGSGNPLLQSAQELRAALTAEITKRDPAANNTTLRQMVVVGHSQGGLLAKATAIDTGTRIWDLFSTNQLEHVELNEADRQRLRDAFLVEPLPFVRRVVFVATPHRGSYLSVGFVRNFAHWLVSLPGATIERSKQLISLTTGSPLGNFLNGRLPTSLDSMSPRNPALMTMAEIPVSPDIKAHSIIAVEGSGDYRLGRDGVLTYQSAHVDYAESEFIVRSHHSCLKQPATIEEVRRILHEHLATLPDHEFARTGGGDSVTPEHTGD